MKNFFNFRNCVIDAEVAKFHIISRVARCRSWTGNYLDPSFFFERTKILERAQLPNCRNRIKPNLVVHLPEMQREPPSYGSLIHFLLSVSSDWGEGGRSWLTDWRSCFSDLRLIMVRISRSSPLIRAILSISNVSFSLDSKLKGKLTNLCMVGLITACFWAAGWRVPVYWNASNSGLTVYLKRGSQSIVEVSWVVETWNMIFIFCLS